MGADVLLDEGENLPAGLPGPGVDVPHGGGHQSGAGQGEAQGLGHTLHGAGGAQEGAGPHRGAAGDFIVPYLLGGDGVLALLPQGDVPGHQGGGHIRAGAHAAAGDEDGGQIQAGGGFQLGRDGLVAGGGENHAVPGVHRAVDLYHIADGLSGGQNVVHAVVALGAAVANIGGVVLGGVAALFEHAVLGLLHNAAQVGAARVAVAKHVLQQNLGLLDVLLVPAGAHLQGVELGPQLALGGASLFDFHRFLLPAASRGPPLCFPRRGMPSASWGAQGMGVLGTVPSLGENRHIMQYCGISREKPGLSPMAAIVPAAQARRRSHTSPRPVQSGQGHCTIDWGRC